MDYNAPYSVIYSNQAHTSAGSFTGVLAGLTELPPRSLARYMKVFRFRFLYQSYGTAPQMDTVQLVFRLMNSSGTANISSTALTYRRADGPIQLGGPTAAGNHPQIDVLVAVALSDSGAGGLQLACDSRITGNITSLSSYILTIERFEYMELKSDAFAAAAVGSIVTPYSDISQLPFSSEVFVCGLRGGYENHYYPISGKGGEYVFDQGPPANNSVNSSVRHMLHTEIVKERADGSIYYKIDEVPQENRHYPRIMASEQVDAVNLGATRCLNMDAASGQNYIVQGVAQTYLFRCHKEDGQVVTEKQTTTTVPNPLGDGNIQMLNHLERISSLSSFNAEQFALWNGVLESKYGAYTVSVYSDDFPAPATDHKWVIGGLETGILVSSSHAPMITPFGYTTRDEVQKCGLIYVSFGRANTPTPEISSVLVQPKYNYLESNSFVNLSSWKTVLNSTVIPNTVTEPEWFVITVFGSHDTEYINNLFRSPTAPFCPFNFDYQTWGNNGYLQVFQGPSASSTSTYLDMINGIDLTEMIEYLIPQEAQNDMIVYAVNLGADFASNLVSTYLGFGPGNFPALPLPRGPIVPRSVLNSKIDLVNFLGRVGQYPIYR